MLLSLLCQHLRLMHYSLVSSVALWQKAFSFLVLRSFSSLLWYPCEPIVIMWFWLPVHCPFPETSRHRLKSEVFWASDMILLVLWVLVLRTLLWSLSTLHLLSGIMSSDSLSKLKAVALKLHLSQFKNEISIIGMSWGHKYIIRNHWRWGGGGRMPILLSRIWSISYRLETYPALSIP